MLDQTRKYNMKRRVSVLILMIFSVALAQSEESKLPIPWEEGLGSPDVNAGKKTHWFRTSDMKMAMLVKCGNSDCEIEIYELDKSILSIPNAPKTADVENERFIIKNVSPYPPLTHSLIRLNYVLIIDKTKPVIYVAPFDKKSGSFDNGNINNELRSEFYKYATAMGWIK